MNVRPGSVALAAMIALGSAQVSKAHYPGESKVTRYARFQSGETIAYGIVEGDRIRQIEGDLFGARRPTEKTHALADVTLLVPTTPSKVLAVGLNYRSHLRDRPAPKVPEIFYKAPSCLIPQGADIVIPKGTNDVHYEGELVIVIGKRAKHVAPGEAMGYVFGVTCGNDVSARDWQKGDLQWWRAKGADTFGPCGPFVVSGLDPDALKLELRVNGEVKQKESTEDLLHDVAAIISWISQAVTLEPGDLIYTGTPGLTTALKPGDVVEVEIEGIGALRNGVTGEP
jgi:2-keto-4-pentenoate hydratase/2-oxohepta-3-ene-1,7-dioic acid hydratase in catechol pathway